MIETAARREKEEWDIKVGDFSEAVIGYLKEKGVDLADPDWAIDDRNVPFTSQYAKVTRVPDAERARRITVSTWQPPPDAARRCARFSTTTPTCARRSPPSSSTDAPIPAASAATCSY